MALLAYNLTAAPVTLAAGNPARVLPASLAPPARGEPFNVTGELHPDLTVDPAHGRVGGLDGAAYAALQVQVTAGSIAFEWTEPSAEYLTTGLTIPGPAIVGAHAPSHKTGGGDAVAVGSTTPTDQNATATNNNTTATNQAATATCVAASVPLLINLGAPVAPDTAGVHAAFAGNDALLAFPGPFVNPDVPRSLDFDFGLGYDGGDITVVGTDYLNAALTVVITAVPNAIVYGEHAFKTVVSASKAAVGANAATVSIGLGGRIGLGANIVGDFGILTADGVAEPGIFSAFYDTVTPDTPPDAAVEFVALVNRSLTVTQNAHNHTQDAHGHTQAAHTHVQNAHTHTLV